MGITALTATGFPFMNMLKMVFARVPQDATFVYQANLDANGYPNNGGVPAGGSTKYLSGQLFLPINYGTAGLKYGFSGTGAGGFLEAITITANTNGVVNGVPGATGSFSSGAIITGTNVAISFFYTAGVASTAVSVNWPTGTYSGMVDEYMVRDSDWAVFQLGGRNAYFTPEFKSFMTGANPRTVRFMDWMSINNSPLSRYAYLPTVQQASFNAERWEPTCWAGFTTNSGDAYTASAPSGWAGRVTGATVQVKFNIANTTTSPTFRVAGDPGAAPIIQLNSATIIVGQLATNQSATLVWDDVIGKWQYKLGGFATTSGGQVAFDYQIALCNQLNMHMWTCFNPLYDVASATAQATAALVGLNSNLRLYAEVGNEVWNTFYGTGYLRQLGTALGFPSTSDRNQIGAYALQVCRLIGAARTVWGASNPKFIGVVAFQAYSPVGCAIGGPNDIYRLCGADCNGTTYPNYAAAGFSNYDTAPNRPVDFCKTLSYATYFSGASMTEIPAAYSNPLNVGGPSGGPNTGLLGAADLYNNGLGSPSDIAAALAFVDWDLRQGNQATILCTSVSASGDAVITVNNFVVTNDIVCLSTTGSFPPEITAGKNYYAITASAGFNTTFKISLTPNGPPITVSGATTGTVRYGVSATQAGILSLNTGATGLGIRGVYPAWNALAANYSLNVDCYEGGMAADAPTEAFCTGTLGLAAGYGTTGNVGGKIYNLLIAYKNNILFQQLQADQYSQFMAQSRSTTPSQYGTISNPAVGARYVMWTPDVFGGPWKNYTAIAAYNA